MLFTPLDLGYVKLKNRIVMPPISTFGWGAPDNSVTALQFEHYRRLGAGGAGLVTVEASCVTQGVDCQRDAIGLWDDRFIPGLTVLFDGIKAGGAKAGIQLMHPSEEPLKGDELRRVAEDFILAAVRVYRAGAQAIELHMAHGYLWDRVCLALGEDTAAKLVSDVKAACPGAAVGVRLGISSPGPEEAIRRAKLFCCAGADYISVSRGVLSFERPEDYAFSALVYGASLVKPHIEKPVFAVWGIRDAQQAESILAAGIADAVCAGRAQLSDPDWANKAKHGEKPNPCRECARCMWYKDGRKCPSQQFLPQEKTARLIIVRP